MALLAVQVAKAIARADFDPAGQRARTREQVPSDASSDAQKDARLRFLRASLGDDAQAERAFERVLAGNELQPVSYLERGAIAARAIARLDLRTRGGVRKGWGTGFLISPRVLLTNHHVFPDVDSALGSFAHFAYETDLDDRPTGPIAFALAPDELFYTSEQLDFTVVAVAAESEDGAAALDAFGCLPLLDVPGKAFELEWLTIVQHPRGERKQLCVRENRLLKRSDDVLWYSTDTLPGSSGSPVFNNDWFVVALHHCGVPETHDGKWRTVDGRDVDPATVDVSEESQIKWIANEGIRASRIAQTLRAALPSHPLLQPLYSATPATARITTRPAPVAATHAMREPAEGMPMSANPTITIRLEIQKDGTVTAASPAERGGFRESAAAEAKRGSRSAKFDAPFDADYATRKGFREDFLGNGAHRVHLPVLSPSLEAEAAPLIQPARGNKHVLHYHNFSVVMHAARRFAIYSAANLRFDQRYDMSRPPDVWRRDPRILDKYQVQNFYYASNKFDRGHLTRREDLEYGGTAREALSSAADTCHWTNCTPQHERFNQNKEIWQGIERHILEATILENDLKAQVITGPVLDEGDPEYKDILYPLQFWKVVVAVDAAGGLSATAYLASQDDVIGTFGIEAVDLFGPFKTFQVRIAEIERLTGLSFLCGADAGTTLRAHDPLEKRAPRRRRRAAPSESALVQQGTEYYELAELDDIVTS